MPRVSVKCEVKTYDHEENSHAEGVKVVVESHWNSSELVVLTIGGERRTVVGSDLVAAIENCQRTK